MAVGFQHFSQLMVEDMKTLESMLDGKMSKDNCFVIKKVTIIFDETTNTFVLEDDRIMESCYVDITFLSIEPIRHHHIGAYTSDGSITFYIDELPEESPICNIFVLIPNREEVT